MKGKLLKRIGGSKIVKAMKMSGELPERKTGTILCPNASSVLTGKFHREPNFDNSPPLFFFLNCFLSNPLLNCNSHTILQVHSLLSCPSP
jgi:hypothetical protein